MQPDAGRVSSAKSEDARAKPTKAERRSERAAARLDAIERNASSIPPAAMHDVFDVSASPEKRSLGSAPPPLPPRDERRKSARPASHKPAPHPPRPTKPPPPAPTLAIPGAPAVSSDDGVELLPNEYEFASESFGLPALAPPRTDAPLELRAELPRHGSHDSPPASIPYRGIALTSAGLMVAVMVAWLLLPKHDERATAIAAATPQRPIAAALPPASSAVVAVNAVETPAPAGAAGDLVAASPQPDAGPGEVPGDPGALASASAAVANGVEPAPTVRRVPRPDAGVAAGFDAAAASSSITAAFARASSCLKDGDPRKSATILLTYAPSGRVTTAVLQGPYSGTVVGGCIASTLRSARVPPFSGDYVTVKRTSVLR